MIFALNRALPNDVLFASYTLYGLAVEVRHDIPHNMTGVGTLEVRGVDSVLSGVACAGYAPRSATWPLRCGYPLRHQSREQFSSRSLVQMFSPSGANDKHLTNQIQGLSLRPPVVTLNSCAGSSCCRWCSFSRRPPWAPKRLMAGSSKSCRICSTATVATRSRPACT